MDSGQFAPRPGDRLGRYELLCALAQGGMGTVWLARFTDSRLGIDRLLALKTILAAHSDNAQFRAMFLDEARIAAEISHESVAHIFDIGEDRGILFFVMEYVDGESLRRLHQLVVKGGHAFPLSIALRVCADACAGLHAAHELRSVDGTPREVVHRDISPHNLLVTLRGTVKLIDFGVAKARDRLSAETAFGTFKGKIGYMAPEQARSVHVDRRADIYSIGAVLYELIAGRPVYDSSSGAQLASLHALMTGAPIAPLPASTPSRVQSLVTRALAPAPDDRFATAAELRGAILETMNREGLQCTDADVSGYITQYCSERLQQRKELIDLALNAAASRRNLDAPLSIPLDVLSSSVDVGAQLPTAADAQRPVGAAETALEPLSATHPGKVGAPSGFMRGVVVASAVAVGLVTVTGVLAIRWRSEPAALQGGATPWASVAAPGPAVPAAPVSAASGPVVAQPPSTAQPGVTGATAVDGGARARTSPPAARPTPPRPEHHTASATENDYGF